MKNEQGISNCPNELKSLLLAFRLLPRDLDGLRKFSNDLESLSEHLNREWREYMNAYDEKDLPNPAIDVDFLKWRAKCDKNIRKLAVSELTEKDVEALEKMNIKITAQNLLWLISEKRILLRIITAFEIWYVDYKRNSPRDFNFGESINTFNFNKDTSLKLAVFSIPEILERKSIPVERIRICPICKNIFWAKRSDSSACSDKDVNAFNSKKSGAKARLKELQNEFSKESKKLQKLIAKYKYSPFTSKEMHPLIAKQHELVDEVDKKITRERGKEIWHFINVRTVNFGG